MKMKDQNTIIQESLMARIRELEHEIANKNYAIQQMSIFLELKDAGRPITGYGTNLQENFINYTVENYDDDDQYELDVRLNPDEVENAMLSYFKSYKTNDEDTKCALECYKNREGLRKPLLSEVSSDDS